MIKILGNRVLLEKLPQKTQSAGGIHFVNHPDFLDDAKRYRVIAVGTGRWVKSKRTKETHHVPIEVVPGDRVLVNVSVLGDIKYLDDGRVLVDASLIEMKW